MIKNRYSLPKDSDVAAEIIYRNSTRSDQFLSLWRLNQAIAQHYAAGFRSFTQFDPKTGAIVARIQDTEEDSQSLPLGESTLLYETNEIMGFLRAMDTRPVATSTIRTLDAIRQQGAANAILGSVVRPQSFKDLEQELDYNYAYLGLGAIHVGIDDHPSMGLFMDVEVIHPLELMPFPHLPIGRTDALGITRRRLITKEALIDIYGDRVIKRLEETPDVRFFDIRAGDPIQLSDLSQTPLANYGSVHTLHSSYKNSDVRVFEILETWINGPLGTIDRFLVTCGHRAIEDRDFTGAELYSPISYQRCYENGTFWGAGHFAMRFGTARRSELLRRSLFKTVLNTENWPLVLFPNGSINERTQLSRLGGSSLRYAKYQLDQSVDRPPQPIMVNPVGQQPAAAQISQFLDGVGFQTNPVPNLSQEKGRIDSASGLQFLDQETKRSINTILQGKRDLLGKAYRTATQSAVRSLIEEPRSLPVPDLTLDLVGASIDPETMEIGFGEDMTPLPNVGRLTFSTMDGHPSNGIAAKMEALQFLQAQYQSWDQFLLFMVKNGIDVAVDLTEVRTAYNTVVKNILLLYNDGQTPQMALINATALRADIQLLILNPFLAGEEFLAASIAVQEALLEYQQFLRNSLEIFLPPGIPEPITATGGGPESETQPTGDMV